MRVLESLVNVVKGYERFLTTTLCDVSTYYIKLKLLFLTLSMLTCFHIL